MNILFISSDVNPFGPISNGDSQRTRLLLQACARLGAVDLVTFRSGAVSDIDNVTVVYSGPVNDALPQKTRIAKWLSLMPWGGMQSLFPIAKERERIIDDIVASGHYDHIVSRYLFRTLPCGLLKYGKRLVVDADDDLTFFFLNQIGNNSNWAQRLRLHLAAAKARRLTLATARELHAVFFSDQHTAISNRGTYLPNIPFHSDTCPDADFSTPRRRILFVGQLDYTPNRDGFDHFLKHIYSPLAATMPELEMHIVGHLNDLSIAERWKQYRGVTLTGFVDDLKEEYTKAHVVVAPIYRCGGTNIKLLEALQMNRCCITTDEALSHIVPPFEDHVDIIGASSDDEYLESLKHMLSSPEAAIAMARNGYNKMQRHYSFEKFATIVADTLTCR